MFRHKLMDLALRALLCLICLAPLNAGTVSAKYTPIITIHKNETQNGFPHSVTFHLLAESDTEIKRVTLIYGVKTTSCVQSEARKDMDFTAGKTIDVKWEWKLDLSGNLPTGIKMAWQWELEDATGSVTRIDEQQIRYEDPNFKWQKLEKSPVTLYWSDGGSGFGATLLQVALSSLDRLEKNAGLTVTQPLEITIYPSAEDMRDSLVMKTEWAGGVAFSEYQVVLIGMPPDQLDWGNEVIPHELAHLVTGMRIFNCQGGYLPTWLNEGLSMYAEGPVSKTTQNRIELVLKKGELPALSTLANGFPANSDLANQAYDQSQMVTSFIIDHYGKEKLDALLDEVRSGKSIDKALRAVYGLDTDGMDQTWRASLGYGTAPEPGNPTETPTPVKTRVPTLALNPSTQGQVTDTPQPTETSAPTHTPTLAPSSTRTLPAPTDEDVAYLETRQALAPPRAAPGVNINPLWVIAGAAGTLICAAGVVAGIILLIVLKRKG